MSYTKGYKAFKKDGTCRGFKFEEGQEYKTEGAPSMCERGFHFCKDLVLALRYYPVESCVTENLYAEVEALGDVEFEEVIKHKACTNHIRIVRFLSDQEVLAMVDDNSNSGDSNSGDSNSGNWNSGDSNSGDSNSGNWNSGNKNSGDSNSGNWNSGDSNSGDSNSGNWNSGNKNSGNWNSGNWNSGNWNSGDSNSGNWNSGNWNSGNWNSGDSNSGDSNSGDSNSGNWNSGNWNSGFFNTETPKEILAFNKFINKDVWAAAYKPDFLYFTQKDGESYKEAFLRSWDESDKINREKIKLLPNFDKDLFFEISGIDVDY